MAGQNTGAAEPQAGGAAQPQAGTQAGGQEPPAGTGQEPAGGTQPGTGDGAGAGAGETAEARAERLERELENTRKEAAGYRTRATAAERTLKERESAGLTDAEKEAKRATELEEQNTRLQAQLRAQAVQSAAVAAATKLNYRNPELAYRLLNLTELEFDEATGAPKGVERQLRELATAEPYLVKPQGSDFGGGTRGEPAGGGGKPPTMNELMKAALGKG